MRYLRVLCVACLAALFADVSPAQAWGRDGHRIVCEIAGRHLSDDARAEVQRLIGHDPQFDHFQEICSWADLVRGSSHRSTAPWHYTNQQQDDPVVDLVDCPRGGCILSATNAHAETFADRSRSDQERLEALKFLAHWLGDLHQPLHVSIVGDRGGNSVPVVWRGRRRTNLHRVWDHDILRDYLGETWPSLPANERWWALADRLAGAPNDAPIYTELDTIGWAQESHDIVRSESFAYYWPDADQPVEADDAYYARNRLVVGQRLEQAGLRLAGVLNQLVDAHGPTAQASDQVRGALE
jgi:hypothetical protein